MGVCLVAYALSDENIAEILADPPLVWRVVSSDDESAYLQELARGAKGSFLGNLFRKPKPAPEIRSLSFTEHELHFVDLDKSWDGLNACLRVCAAEAPNFFEGSGEVGKVEVGYAPALYHRRETMARIAAAYAGLAHEDLLKAFRSADLTGTYPQGLWRRDDPEIESYLMENFAELQAFVRYTKEHSLGVVIQFT